MNKTEMTNYMRQQMWVDRVEVSIASWEKVQGIVIDDDIKENIIKFVEPKIKKGIENNTLTRVFMQIAVTALLYIKTKNIQ